MIKSINPFTGELTAEFDPMTDDVCREAVFKGRVAFEKWKRLSVSDRVKPVEKLASIFRRKKGRICAPLCRRNGQACPGGRV